MPHSREYGEEVWNLRRDLIYDLVARKTSKAEVLRRIQEPELKFEPSVYQLSAQLREWSLTCWSRPNAQAFLLNNYNKRLINKTNESQGQRSNEQVPVFDKDQGQADVLCQFPANNNHERPATEHCRGPMNNDYQLLSRQQYPGPVDDSYQRQSAMHYQEPIKSDYQLPGIQHCPGPDQWPNYQVHVNSHHQSTVNERYESPINNIYTLPASEHYLDYDYQWPTTEYYHAVNDDF